MRLYTLFILIAICSLPTMAQHQHSADSDIKAEATPNPTFADRNLQASYNLYIEVKNLLVSSLPSETKMKATELELALLKTTSGTTAAKAAQKISQSTKLEEQRNFFIVLSDEMTRLVKEAKLSSGSIYVEYCPMANNNEGAYWLSNEKEIRNPYFGNRMLKCGTVKETIQ